MKITMYRLLPAFAALFLSTASVFAAETINDNATVKSVDTSSSQVPLAEKNTLQEPPEYKGTDQQITTPSSSVTKTSSQTVEKTKKDTPTGHQQIDKKKGDTKKYHPVIKTKYIL